MGLSEVTAMGGSVPEADRRNTEHDKETFYDRKSPRALLRRLNPYCARALDAAASRVRPAPMRK